MGKPFTMSETSTPTPPGPPSQGGERARSAAPSFDRAQQKHPSPNRRSSPVNTNFLSAQPCPPQDDPLLSGIWLTSNVGHTHRVRWLRDKPATVLAHADGGNPAEPRMISAHPRGSDPVWLRCWPLPDLARQFLDLGLQACHLVLGRQVEPVDDREHGRVELGLKVVARVL